MPSLNGLAGLFARVNLARFDNFPALRFLRLAGCSGFLLDSVAVPDLVYLDARECKGVFGGGAAIFLPP